MGLEVADIFRDHGAAWREANRGHLSLGQLKVMSAIERCRTAALGGHVMRCENDACGYTAIAYNSCRNRHCPKCQGAAAREWMEARAAELLPVPYFHVVFTLPSPIGDIAYQNKAVIYNLLFRASAETMLMIAADPKHLGARIGITAVLHTWGSAMAAARYDHVPLPASQWRDPTFFGLTQPCGHFLWTLSATHRSSSDARHLLIDDGGGSAAIGFRCSARDWSARHDRRSQLRSQSKRVADPW